MSVPLARPCRARCMPAGARCVPNSTSGAAPCASWHFVRGPDVIVGLVFCCMVAFVFSYLLVVCHREGGVLRWRGHTLAGGLVSSCCRLTAAFLFILGSKSCSVLVGYHSVARGRAPVCWDGSCSPVALHIFLVRKTHLFSSASRSCRSAHFLLPLHTVIARCGPHVCRGSSVVGSAGVCQRPFGPAFCEKRPPSPALAVHGAATVVGQTPCLHGARATAFFEHLRASVRTRPGKESCWLTNQEFRPACRGAVMQNNGNAMWIRCT